MPKRSTLTDDAMRLAQDVEAEAIETVESEFAIPLGTETATAGERRKRIAELPPDQEDIINQTFGGRANFLFGRRQQ